VGGYTKVICKYYAILYKRLEHPQILVSPGVLKTNPSWLPRDYCKDKQGPDHGESFICCAKDFGI
jgi:hypothetical protein